MTGTSELADPPGPDIAHQHLDLASRFPTVTREQWEELAAAALSRGGAALEPAAAMKRLTSETLDGIAIRPLYTADDAPGDPGLPGQAPFLRSATPDAGTLSGWDIRARYDAETAGDPAEAILTDLTNGTSSVWLQFADETRPGLDLATLPALLKEVFLDLAPIVLDAGARTTEAADALLALVRERGIADAEFVAVLGADPIGLAARTGGAVDFEPLRALATRVNGAYPQVRAGVVDATVFHEAGATDAQQLALALSAGVACLRELIDAGLAPADAAAQLEFRYGVTDEQFPTIALLRAARRLWSQVTEASGVEGGAGQIQHAVTSWAMLSRHDLPVNILRGTVATFAAGVGGARAITVLPFDSATGADSVLSRRIARNTSTLLIEESNIGRVIDPGGGSWYIETLSDDLAKAAWAIFQEIEGAGGIVAALSGGWVAQQLAASTAKRGADTARRKITLTGVSEFPNLAEPAPAREERPATAGLPRRRYAEGYEALRDRADAHLAATGRRPVVVLATIGALRDYSARVGFASGALAPGGVDVVEIPADDTAALKAAFDGGVAVACLCSSDPIYAEKAAETAAAVRAAGARSIYLAGRPARDLEAGFREAGISGFMFIGSDILGMLGDVLTESGVASS